MLCVLSLILRLAGVFTWAILSRNGNSVGFLFLKEVNCSLDIFQRVLALPDSYVKEHCLTAAANLLRVEPSVEMDGFFVALFERSPENLVGTANTDRLLTKSNKNGGEPSGKGKGKKHKRKRKGKRLANKEVELNRQCHKLTASATSA